MEEPPTVLKNQSSTTSSQRGHKRKLLSNLPLDPVTDIADLYALVFHKKPDKEYTNMWGKGYLETYYPRENASHNKNVQRIRILL